MSKKISRADFLKTSAAGLAAMTVVPGNVMGSAFGHKAPSDKLNIAGVGIGGRGSAVLDDLKEENIVALCDTDWNYAKGTFDRFSKAQRFWDWREMYDKIANQIDAVMCATPDHTHALVAANAMELGKHVYCEKPLTHTVYESRLLTKLAAKNGVATQMGNQGSSGEGVQKVCDWIWNGEIGEVTRVDAFTDRPIWPQGLMRPSQVDPIPETLNWDLFLGSAPYRPYNKIYQPWNWRGWWDFGTGALGDMACHILHPVFKALQLGYPTKVQGSSTALLTDCAPQAQMVTYVFPERGKKLPRGRQIFRRLGMSRAAQIHDVFEAFTDRVDALVDKLVGFRNVKADALEGTVVFQHLRTDFLKRFRPVLAVLGDISVDAGFPGLAPRTSGSRAALP